MAPLIVIVGETASGKSALAMQIAHQFSGEIVCADSRTIYKTMDIGTAKPSTDDRAKIRHHGLDVVEPGERFTAADFKDLANQAIADITSRGKLPILVGGTGLYVDAVIYDFQFPKGEERDPLNPRHRNVAKTDNTLRPNTLILGVQIDREVLNTRITERVEQMVQQGLEAEVAGIGQQYGWGSEALKGIGYREWQEYFDGSINLEQIKQKIINDTIGYAKRQRTWFKRNNSIHWLNNRDKVEDIVTTFLNKSS